jgi:hypothetical protein
VIGAPTPDRPRALQTVPECPLSEVMGYAAILLAGIWAATATVEVPLPRPGALRRAAALVAGVADARGRRVRAWARLHLPDGGVGAEATGLLVALPPEVAERARALYGPWPDRAVTSQVGGLLPPTSTP